MADLLENYRIHNIEVGVDVIRPYNAIRITRSATYQTYGRITLFNGKVPITGNLISSGQAICIATLPISGTTIEVPCFIENTGEILIPLSNENIIAEIGEVVYEIRITGENSDGKYRMTSLNFRATITT